MSPCRLSFLKKFGAQASDLSLVFAKAQVGIEI
jgi:hypothetical protein